MTYLPCETVETSSSINASVIWLHGLGASGHDFVPIVPELRLPAELGVRFVFPHAPQIPVTINGGYVMPAWYDIISMDAGREIDTPQIMQSAQAVVDLIEREIERGVPSERIVLAGFYQGGAVCYQAALSYNKPLAGLMAMSTYFATASGIELSEANRQLPVFVSHGTMDEMVQENLGQHAVSVLQEFGYAPEYKTYPMGHEVCRPQIDAISAWLQKVLA